jgi:hypothetical protein
MLDKAQAVGLTVFLITQFSLSSLYSPLMLVGWTGLAGAVVCVYLAPNKIDRPFWILGALIFLQISQLLAIPGAAIWGNGNWVLTAGVVLWVLPMPLVYLAANRHIEKCVCAFAIVHALLIIFQGFTNYHWVEGIVIWEDIPQGFSHNGNLAAGLLVMCLPFAVSGHWRWASIPFLAAVIFTGSRWAFIVVSIMVMAMGYKEFISVRWVLGGLSSLLITIAVIGLFTPATAAVAGYNSIAQGFAVASQVEVRLAVAEWPNLLPYGIAETDGLHNVPMRMAAEWGIISAVIWVTLTVWGLTRMKFSPAWWLMLAIALLSLLDHYTWRPHLMGFWFVALGLLAVKSIESNLVHQVITDDPL